MANVATVAYSVNIVRHKNLSVANAEALYNLPTVILNENAQVNIADVSCLLNTIECETTQLADVDVGYSVIGISGNEPRPAAVAGYGVTTALRLGFGQFNSIDVGYSVVVKVPEEVK